MPGVGVIRFLVSLMAKRGKDAGIKYALKNRFTSQQISKALAKRKEIISWGIARQRPSSLPRSMRESLPSKTGNQYVREYTNAYYAKKK